MSLTGTFNPPGDKSISHRIALLALQSSGVCQVENYAPGEDCCSSLQVIQQLGCSVESIDPALAITGVAGQLTNPATLDCGNSGTTMRLLMGLLAGTEGQYRLDGDASLRGRPMDRIAEPLRLLGAAIDTTDGRCPLTIHGQKLTGTTYELPIASAQLKSAVLLAGIQAEGQTTVIEPVRCRDHTERMLRAFGAPLRSENDTHHIAKGLLQLPDRFYIPGDPSSAAFFLCAAAMQDGADVTAHGCLLNPTRIGFLDVLQRMGADLYINTTTQTPEPCGDVRVYGGRPLKAVCVNADEIPSLVDEIPILALLATQALGTTVFEGVSELRVKETDRLAAIGDQLGLMGAKIEIRSENSQDTLLIHGPTPLTPPTGPLNSYGDHRIAMTMRLALCLTGVEADIADEVCVAVSYPAFHEELDRLAR